MNLSHDTPPHRNSQIKMAFVAFALLLATIILPNQTWQIFDFVGYAVCHRITERSFVVNQIQLPMCARDTGMFGVSLLTIVSYIFISPKRYTKLPTLFFAMLLCLGALTWVIDGFNSYFLLATGRINWYMPQNWLRLLTGALMGSAIGAFVVPVFNTTVWRPELTIYESSLSHASQLARVWGIALFWVMLVIWQPSQLYGLYALVSGFGAVTLLTIVNGLIVLLIMRREATITLIKQLLVPMGIGFVMTCLEVAAIVSLRLWLTAKLNLPF